MGIGGRRRGFVRIRAYGIFRIRDALVRIWIGGVFGYGERGGLGEMKS